MCTCGACRARTRRQQAPAVAAAAVMRQRWMATSRAQRHLLQLCLSRMHAMVSCPTALTAPVVCCASLLQAKLAGVQGPLYLNVCCDVLPAADLADARQGYQLLRLPILPQGDCKAAAVLLMATAVPAAASASALSSCWLGFLFNCIQRSPGGVQ